MTIEYKDSKRFSGLSDGVSSGYDVANISYSGKSSSSSSQNTYMLGIGFNADGTKMYRTGYSSTRAIFQYTLSTAWDISTASYDNVSFSLPSPQAVPYGFEWNGDGTKFVVGDNSTGNFYQYSLSTAYDISTTNSTPATYDPSETSKPVAFKFTNSGTKAFVLSQNTDTVLRYSLSTAYDITTMSYDSNSYTFTGSYYCTGLEFNSDGTEMYLQDHTGNSLRRFTLSTSYDLSTASLTSSFSTSSQFGSSTSSALRFSADGTKLYISGYGTSDFQYDTESTASDKTLLTNVQDNSLFVEKDTAKRYWFTPTVEPANSANFDASSNDHIDIPTTGLTSLANGSVSFWLNVDTDTPNGGDNVVFSCSNSSTASSEWVIGYYGSTNKISVLSRNNGSNVVSYQAGSLAKGTWYHIVYTNSSSTGNKLYINGSVVTPSYSQGSASTNAFISSVSSINTCNIGANKDNGGYQWGFDGNIQQVLVYGSTLTSSDVTALYNGGNYNSSPSATNLLRRYELTSNVNDTSGNAHNGTATGVIFTSEAIPNSPTTTTTAWKQFLSGIGVFPVSTSTTDNIDYIVIETLGNAVDFGDLTTNRGNPLGASNTTRGIFSGGNDGSYSTTMDYITLSTTGNATTFGDNTQARGSGGDGVSSETRAVFAGGQYPRRNTIDYVTIATTGNATDFGDLTNSRGDCGGVDDDVRGVFAGGYSGGAVNTIDYITIATPSNATSFGGLPSAEYGVGNGMSNKTRGVFPSGYNGHTKAMSYVTISTTGNAITFGNMVFNGEYTAGASSSTRGILAGGTNRDAGGDTKIIQYITIATTGNATTFGDLTTARSASTGVSDF